MFRSKVQRTALLAAVGLVLAACGGAPKVTLTGRVIDAYTQQPVNGASLTFAERQPLQTNADGSFATTDWSAQDSVQVAAPGYETATLNLADKPELADTKAQTVTLDTQIRPNTLSGVVTDAYTGEPIPSAQVSVSPTISATTDASGKYTLEGVPEQFQISLSAPDYAEAKADINRLTAHQTALRPNVLRGKVVNKYTGQGIAGIEVSAGDAKATTADDGTYELRGMSENAKVVFSGQGYAPVEMDGGRQTSLDATLTPSTITGTVVDAETGKPLKEATVIATATISGTDVAYTRTGSDGSYTLENVPEGAYIKALLPGYLRGETQVKEGEMSAELKLEPHFAKSLYLKANVASFGIETVREYYDVIDQTELNSIVIDLKSDNLEDVGFIYYQSQVPEVVAAETSADYMPIRQMLAEAKERGIYTVARIHVFAHDNALLEKHPDWYVQLNGKPWFADFGIAWLDAYDERVWDYNIKLGVEAAQLGFDEIQFDYIRFPSDGDLTGTVFKGPRDWRNDPQPMFDNIARLCERAQRAINGAGAYFSVDVFGYAAWQPQDNIGQNLQLMGKHIDYVYPMVYPSHFLFGELGFENPGAHPFEIVDASMQKIKDQLTGEASRAKVKPWLQDFTLIWVPDQYIVEYGAAEVRAQIDAAEKNRASGVVGWALWDPDNDYEGGALKPQE